MCRVSRPGARQLRPELCSPLCNSVLCSDFIIARENGGTEEAKQQAHRKIYTDKMGMLCIVSLHSYCQMGLESAMVIYFSIEISYNYFQVGGTGPVTRWPVCLI